MTTTPTAFSYLRFSTPRQQWGDSLRRQTELSRAYAQRHGLKLDDRSFQDLGVSGFTGRNVRDGDLGAFIKAVQDGKIKRGSYLLVESLDRLSRDRVLAAFESFRRLLELGVVIVTLQDEKRYTKEGLSENFTDLMLSLLTMQRAHEESLTKSKRLGAVWAAKRKSAVVARVPLTSTCPSWLKLDKVTKKYSVIPEKAKAVQRIFEMAATGNGHEYIARRLNEDRVPGIGRVSHWHASYVLKILVNPAVIGTYQPMRNHRDPDGGRRRVRVPDGESIEGYFPAVVSKALFLKVREGRRERRLPPGPKGATRSNLFSGLLRCGRCGGPIFYVNHGNTYKGHQYLMCAAARRGIGKCGRDAWSYQKFEPVILIALWKHIDWRGMLPRMKDAVQDQIAGLEERKAVLEVQLQGIKERITRVVDAIEQGGTTETLPARLRELEERRTALEKETAEVGEKLHAEQERLRTAKESAREVREAFAEYMHRYVRGENGAVSESRRGDSEDRRAARERLAAALRETIQEMRLHGNGKDDASVVEVILRNGSDPLRLPVKLMEKLDEALQATAQRTLRQALSQLRIP